MRGFGIAALLLCIGTAAAQEIPTSPLTSAAPSLGTAPAATVPADSPPAEREVTTYEPTKRALTFPRQSHSSDAEHGTRRADGPRRHLRPPPSCGSARPAPT